MYLYSTVLDKLKKQHFLDLEFHKSALVHIETLTEQTAYALRDECLIIYNAFEIHYDAM